MVNQALSGAAVHTARPEERDPVVLAAAIRTLLAATPNVPAHADRTPDLSAGAGPGFELSGGAAAGPDAAAAARPDAAAAAELHAGAGADPNLIATTWAMCGGGPLVIDDAHVLQDSAALDLLVTTVALPGSGPLVLCTRRELPLTAHPSGVTQSRLDAVHLRLDLDAVASLIEATQPADRALAARLVDATGGWPAAVGLAVLALQALSPNERSQRIRAATAPGAPVGRYLAEVVLRELSDSERRWLLLCEQLGSTDAEEVARLAGPDARGAADPHATADLHETADLHAMADRTPVQTAGTDATDALTDLRRRGLLSADPDHPDRDGAVRVAPVLGRLLRRVWDPAEADALATRLVADGQPVRALRLLHDAGRWAAAGELLRSHGEALLAAGALPLITGTAARLADQADPDLRLVVAEALALQGSWAEARDLLGTAPHHDGPLPVPLARRLGLVEHMRGDLAAALAAYARADVTVTPVGQEPTHDARDHAAARPTDHTAAADDANAEAILLTGWKATAHWLRGEVEAARQDALRAQAAAAAGGDQRALATAHTALALVAASDGDRRANENHYRLALVAAERAGDRVQEARIRTNLGSHHLEEGRYAEARRETELAIDLATAQGYAAVAGIARCNRADIALRTGDLDAAIADAEEAQALFARIGSRTEAYAHHLLGRARAARGDLVLARRAFEEALRLGTPSGDRQALAPAHAGLARVLAGSDPAAARAAADEAVALDDGLWRAEAHLARAWAALACDDRDTAARAAAIARDDATQRGNHPAHAEAVTALALAAEDPRPGLREAQELWRALEDPVWTVRVDLGVARRATNPAARAQAGWLERRLATLGAHPERGTFAHRLVSGSLESPRTIVRLLGGFAVEQGGQPIPPSAWGSRKARELLKALAVRRDRPATREELAHLLWPDEPYDRVSNRLSVALSLLRGQLSPDGPPAIASHAGTLRLSDEVVELDVEVFERLAEDGLTAARSQARPAAVALLLQAEERYGGDLLADEPDLRWAEDRRAELRALYLTVARTLADLVADDDPDLAIRLLLRVLDRDGYDEPAHLDVCLALLRAGRHGEARRRHHLYATRMAELELPAVPLHELVRAARGRAEAAS